MAVLYLWTVTVTELMLILLSSLLYIPFVRLVAASSQFHPNLIRIFVFLSSSLAIHSLSRAILMLFQFEILHRYVSPFIDCLLFSASIVRAFLGSMAALTVPLIIIERIFATYYIWDYEAQPRLWVSKWLIGFMTFVCLVIGTGFLIEFAIDPKACVYGFVSILGVVAVLLQIVYWRLSSHTDMVLSALSSMLYGEQGYLSVRYQVEENIRVFRLMRRFVVANSLSMVVGMVIAFLCFFAQTNSQWSEIVKCFFELYIAIYVLNFVGICVRTVPEWRWQYRSRLNGCLPYSALSGHHRVRPSQIIVIQPSMEAKVYFEIYNRSW
ncbi:unnamed protein product, partial [Mesorhabditis spiculigera]